MSKGISRRKFVKNSVFGLGSAGLLGGRRILGRSDPASGQTGNDTRPVIRKYRPLGRTGFQVSDISLGFSSNEAIIKTALDAGVNYIDSAESYQNHRVVGKAIQGRDRKSIFITSKLEIKEKEGLSRESFIQRFHRCLEELQTDYIDCMMVHSPDTVADLLTPGFHSAMEQMKKEGKLHFVGVSNHGSNHPVVTKESMETILTAAAEDGRFDVFLMAYNFLQADNGEKVLALCNRKGIGTTIMKKNPVGTYYRIKNYLDRTREQGKEPNRYYADSLARFQKKAEQAESFIQKYHLQNQNEIRDAAIRFVLNNPHVSSAVCSMRNFDQIEQFIRLSGTDLSQYDREKLSAYRKGCGPLYCRHACGECESACPVGVPVNTIMRYHHYFSAQGKEKYALKKYLALQTPKPDVCGDCPGYCESACSYGVPIQGMLIMAHHHLSLV